MPRLPSRLILVLSAACVLGCPREATAASASAQGASGAGAHAHHAHGSAASAAAGAFTLNPGDHIAIVGDGLAERMQHDGWLETFLHARFPQHDLVVRDLGFAGDEVVVRPRSKNFGTPDQHLERCKTDVVIAFFGRNESFEGEAGLPKFEADLATWVHHVRQLRYGKGETRVVLCSPIEQEARPFPQQADVTATNERLKLYTETMRRVAAQHGAAFVDLFTRAPGGDDWTIDGIRLTKQGNRRVAESIDAALFSGPRPAAAHEAKIRAAVLVKNDAWFHRYRTTDGYSIYGDRGDLQFVAGQTNRDVMNRELEVLDTMTANRDRAIWARARGEYFAVDDTNTPPFLPVETNIKGKGDGGAHVFLGGEEAIARMTVAEGLQVNLFASEEQFPALVNPNQCAVDPRGRLWVTAWPTYPHWQPKTPRNDKLLILPDDDGDGRADRCIEFASDLHNPTGFDFWNGGVLVAQVPDLWFLKDIDGDDLADVRVRVLSGIDSADTHHSINSFVFSPGGALYMQEGTFHHTGVETPWGPPVRSFNAGVFRYEPRSDRFEVYAAYGFANPHGHVFDRWGQDFVTDGTGAVPYWGAAISVHTEHPRKVAGAPTVYRQRTRPCGGTAILSSAHFPEAMQGNWLVSNCIGFLGILQYRFEDDGAGFQATEVEPLVSSTDSNFRPVDVEIGGDGAVYFVDWQNPIIGHMQHNLRDPSRDRVHGRVYRISNPERSRLTPKANHEASEATLMAQLAERDDPVRYRARRELSGRPPAKVLVALQAWLAALPADAPDREHLLLEALWVQQMCDAVDADHLRRVLRSPEARARAAATRVLCEVRHTAPYALDVLGEMVVDPDARVRAEVVRACSFFASARAAEIALRAASQPLDRYLRYMLRETMLTLRPQWTEAIRAGESFAKGHDAGLAWLLDMVDAADLARLPRTDAVCKALLGRAGVAASERRSALEALAQKSGRPALVELLASLRGAASDAPGATDLGALLVAWPPAELTGRLAEVQALAREAKRSDVRAAAYGAWVRASGGVASAWETASTSVAALSELLRGIAFGGELPATAGDAWARVQPLMFGVPESLAAGAPGSTGVAFSLYEEQSFPDVRRETLAALTPKAMGTVETFTHEVPGITSEPYALVLSATLSVAAPGKYTFFCASDDGSRLWVDDREVVSNDGPHGVVEKRGTIDLLVGQHPIVVTYYDAGGADHLRLAWSGPGFGKQDIPAAALSVDGSLALRRAAIAAAVRVPGQRDAKFADLAQLVRADQVRGAAVDALLQMPCAEMPAPVARVLVRDLLRIATAAAPAEREAEAWKRVVRLTEQLAGALPAAEATPVRASLTAINPQVVELRTVPEKMRYDQEEFAVTAGRPVRLVLRNPDAMQHNLLILAPGSLEAIGALADVMGADGFAKNFVPQDPRVLHSIRLLNPGESATLEFTAPSTPGDYPYVCTFPGHWRIMRGVMHVRP